MTPPFFPSASFGWVFCGLLLTLLGLATYHDLKRLLIPKWLTLPLLATGLVANVLRKTCLAGDAWGLLDGFLFALAGFGTGFGLFFLMWLLGTCGGGDVKLFAALGAWIGPLLAVYVLGWTILLVVVLSFVRLATRSPSRGLTRSLNDYSMREKTASTNTGAKPRRRLMAYSLPVTLSVAMVLPWVCRFDLNLASRPATDERAPATQP
jgi:prepilin peptidase CpaA